MEQEAAQKAPVITVLDYEITIMHRDGSVDKRVIMARHSVDAITIALRTARREYGEIRSLTCRVVA